MKNLLTLLGSACVVASVSNAAIYSLYTDASSEAGIDYRFETDDSTYIADTVDGSSIFGSGDAFRIADLSSDDKPEAAWESSVPTLTGGFRLSMDAFNNAEDTNSSVDVNLRFSDQDDTITSSSNVMTSISFEASSKLKIGGSTVHTFTGATTVDFIINASDSSALAYSFGDSSASLDALQIATFIDGVLVDTRDMSPGGNYDTSLGVARFGFVGESDSKNGVDYIYDNIALFTGADINSISVIPEPSAIGLLIGAFALGFVTRRRR